MFFFQICGEQAVAKIVRKAGGGKKRKKQTSASIEVRNTSEKKKKKKKKDKLSIGAIFARSKGGTDNTGNGRSSSSGSSAMTTSAGSARTTTSSPHGEGRSSAPRTVMDLKEYERRVKIAEQKAARKASRGLNSMLAAGVNGTEQDAPTLPFQRMGVKGVSPNPGVHRQDQASGLPVYKISALGMNQTSGGTPDCPFDCWCCF